MPPKPGKARKDAENKMPRKKQKPVPDKEKEDVEVGEIGTKTIVICRICKLLHPKGAQCPKKLDEVKVGEKTSIDHNHDADVNDSKSKRYVMTEQRCNDISMLDHKENIRKRKLKNERKECEGKIKLMKTTDDRYDFEHVTTIEDEASDYEEDHPNSHLGSVMPKQQQQQPYIPSQQQPYIPSQQQPYIPSQQQPYIPSQQQPYMPSQQQPYMPTLQQPYMPSQQQPCMPNQQQLYMPTPQQPYVPSQQQPYLPTLHQPYTANRQQPYMPSQQQPYMLSQQHQPYMLGQQQPYMLSQSFNPMHYPFTASQYFMPSQHFMPNQKSLMTGTSIHQGEMKCFRPAASESESSTSSQVQHPFKRRVKSPEDAVDTYTAVLDVVKGEKLSRHQALLKIGKDLKSFNVCENIYALKVTRPDVFQKILDEWDGKALYKLSAQCADMIIPELVEEARKKGELLRN